MHAGGAGGCGPGFSGADDGSMSVEVADGAGLPVLSVGSLVTRPISAEQLAAALQRGRAGARSGAVGGGVVTNHPGGPRS